MDSPQSVVSPLKSSSVLPESEKRSNANFVENLQQKGTENGDSKNTIGALEVYIHQARDIHNICIYQKQDVYAKLCLTSDPEETVSTKIVNGGGRNPIFNESMRLSIRKVESSLKCEIWMLSRVRNYLEDQLLGFALVPISEVLLQNGKLEKEFSLSSTDLFHSPAGFVRLSVSYIGTPPEVIPVPAPASESDAALQESEESAKSVPDDLDKIEFPDPKIVNENHQMVEEYISMPRPNLESQSSDTENRANSEVKTPDSKIESPPSSVSTNGTSPASVPASVESSEEHIVPPKDSSKNNNGVNAATFVKPVVPEPEVIQQDIVNMYMKSMQQFTESLAKMKLPMDFESGPTSSENSSSDQKSPASKNSGSRVFYGSRAFF
ncbi:uncharacterized protein LOC127247464 [Andrographis paniculata]|uniref:uncharacterized protein LOC127247464 n=1 Tax=Andrographis paniculata TaxID=175694 RepID=UPI0021E81BAB|nr:uncharacterized protein LOC127247464 [Andrographis paniculata]XP_051125257.1 uncharacterized protein LOC127247464 [Andrographis paniculata]